MRGFSECLRQELLDEQDIHVCAVLPASIDTPLFQHAANYTGRAVKAMRSVYDAGKVARAIVRCAERPRKEVMVGNSGRMLSLTHTLAPGMAERMIARQVEKDHFQDAPAPPTAGNVFAPMPEWTGVSGGWKSDGATPMRRAAVTGLATLAPALLGWFWLRPRMAASRRWSLKS